MFAKTIRRMGLIAALALGAGAACGAQSVSNFYAGEVSYNGAGTPPIAGSAFYGHQVSADTAPGMYAFAVYDVLATGTKPLTLTNSVGVGIAQKVLTIAGVDVFAPTTAGVAYNGPNVGWAWNTGVIAPIRYKKTDFFLVPTLRVSKASVGGNGYTPIFGFGLGWGK